MLDATLKETNIWRSIKKFFIENTGSGSPSYPVYFDRVIVAGNFTDEQWINVTVENVIPNYVSHAVMTIYLCSRFDREGDELACMRDFVLQYLYSGYIDLYDTTTDPWKKIGAMKLFIKEQSDTLYNPDRSKMIYFLCLLKWGAVWSR